MTTRRKPLRKFRRFLELERLEDRTLLTTPTIIAGTLYSAQNYDNDVAVNGGSASIPPDPSGAAGPSHSSNSVRPTSASGPSSFPPPAGLPDRPPFA